jgi:hypothetical protein
MEKLFRTKLWTTLSILPFRSAWILKPDSLPSSYISFLNKHGGKDISIVKGFKELALKIEPFTALKAIEEHYKSTGVDLQLDPQMSIPCKVMTTPLLHKQPIILYGNHLHLCTLWLEAVCVEDQFSHFCSFALGCFHMLCSIWFRAWDYFVDWEYISMLWLHADDTWKPRMCATFILFLGTSIFAVTASLYTSLFCSCTFGASSRPFCKVMTFFESNTLHSYLFISNTKDR